MISSQQSDLFRIWNTLRGRRRMPRVSDLKPSLISAHLQDLLIIEQREAESTRVRLAGTAVCALLGRELSGQNFINVWQSRDQADVQRLLKAVFDETSAAVIGAIGHRPDYPAEAMSCILLPLEADHGQPRRIVGSLISNSGTNAAFFPVADLQIASIRILDPDKPVTGLYATGVKRGDVALQRGHLVLLKSALQSGVSSSKVIHR
jgi:hypothetical protein